MSQDWILSKFPFACLNSLKMSCVLANFKKKSFVESPVLRKFNIVDNMLDMMEKYANNLEEIVEQRTSELVEEKKKTDSLLFRMLPRSLSSIFL